MYLYHCKTPFGNFGDDLNVSLWPELIPDVWECDGIVFLGVGTVLGMSSIPKAAKYVVAGSGAGIGADILSSSASTWHYYWVRGPLTETLLRLPQGTAISDGAMLLRTFHKPNTERKNKIAFVPHHTTATFGNWECVCDLAGFEFVDPRSEWISVVRQIASAKLVLTESLHGAIVADTYRVPWIPVVTFASINSINIFKWEDWCRSIGVPFRPIHLAPSSLVRYVQRFARSNGGAFGDNNLWKQAKPIAKFGTPVQYEFCSDKVLSAAKAKMGAPVANKQGGEIRQKPNWLNQKNAIKHWVSRLDGSAAMRVVNRPFLEAAAESLAAAVQASPSLSKDQDLDSVVARMREKVYLLDRDYAAGRLTRMNDR